ncbi:MAG: hypothetical protein C4523_12225 [Myxococcales bacterium]|nr:MAG: hypothetical protein C4523_12225 [Myxococcales bacterium]
MQSIHDAEQIGPILRELILKWAGKVFPKNIPEILVVDACKEPIGYTLGSAITLAVTAQYDRSYAFGDYRVYMGPVDDVEEEAAADRGYLLPEEQRSGHAITDGLVWLLRGRVLHIARVDEASLATRDHSPLNNEGRKKVLTEIFHTPFAKLFMTCKTPPTEGETVAAFGKFYGEVSKTVLTRTETDIQTNVDRLADLNAQVQQTLSTLVHQREQLRLLKLAVNEKCAKTEVNIERIGRQLHRLVGPRIESITISEKELTAVHKDVVIEDAESGETSELGDIRLRLLLEDGKDLIRFEGVSNNEDRSGYIHPHVAKNGAPCLGNIGNDVGKLLEQREWGTLVLLLDEFLRSYNDENPYMQWFGGDRDEYDACYEGGDESCADCHDSNCPYWADRWDRCHENCSTQDCMWCANTACAYIEEELAECRSNHTRAECLKCRIAHCGHHPASEEECHEWNADDCDECERRGECLAWAGEKESDCYDEYGPGRCESCAHAPDCQVLRTTPVDGQDAGEADAPQPEPAGAAVGGGGAATESLDAGGAG